MRYQARKVSRLLILMVMLVSVAALSFSNGASVCALGLGFCETCSGECYDESYHLYHTCKEKGGSEENCLAQQDQYYHNCQVTLCSGCPIIN